MKFRDFQKLSKEQQREYFEACQKKAAACRKQTTATSKK